MFSMLAQLSPTTGNETSRSSNAIAAQRAESSAGGRARNMGRPELEGYLLCEGGLAQKCDARYFRLR